MGERSPPAADARGTLALSLVVRTKADNAIVMSCFALHQGGKRSRFLLRVVLASEKFAVTRIKTVVRGGAWRRNCRRDDCLPYPGFSERLLANGFKFEFSVRDPNH